MFRKIYEKLETGQPAVYQIKFKGKLPSILRKRTEQFRITTESYDRLHPVTMLTGKLNGQDDLLSLINTLHREGCGIISMVCIEIVSNGENEYATASD